MEAVLKRNDNDIVDAYWNMLSSLSRTVKLRLATKLTNAVLEEEMCDQSHHSRKAKVRKRASLVLSDAELAARFTNTEMPDYPEDDFSCEDIIKANSGKTIKPVEKWL